MGTRQQEEGLDVKVARYVRVADVLVAELDALCQSVSFE
jgi:hypothetical protein